MGKSGPSGVTEVQFSAWKRCGLPSETVTSGAFRRVEMAADTRPRNPRNSQNSNHPPIKDFDDPRKKNQKTPKSLDDVTGCRQKKTMEYPLNVNCTFFSSHWKPTEPYLSILYWNCCQFLFTTNLWYRWGNSLDCLFLNSCGRTPFLSQIKSNPSIADDRLGICEIFLCADKTGQSKNAREHSSGKESTESRCWTRVEVNARNRRTFYPIRKKIFVAALQVERSIIFLKRD